MLEIKIKKTELFDDESQQFIYIKEQTLQLEHSLISISKWESKWMKPFLVNTPRTMAETIDYIKCMTLNKSVDPNVYFGLTKENLNEIEKYIQAPMTASVIPETKNGKKSPEQTTSELIYYWMVALNIPFECEKWHLNRLITLIRICEIKNQPPKKSNAKDIAGRYAAMNASRLKKYNTKG